MPTPRSEDLENVLEEWETNNEEEAVEFDVSVQAFHRSKVCTVHFTFTMPFIGAMYRSDS